MAILILRNIDDEIVKALKSRACRKGISAEAEHRNLLAAALLNPQRRSFAEVIQSIPPVGDDDDFSSQQDEQPNHVFT